MGIKVVTFTVQLGSDGFEIARGVAEKMGFRFLDHEVIAQAAAIAGVSPETIAAAERWPTFVERMLERLALTTVVSEGTLPSPPANPATMMLTSADYRALIEQVVTSLAEEGNCVIVGHAGQAILKDTPGVFKVLVHGSEESRTQRVADAEGLDYKAALKRVRDSDHQRAAFFKHVYEVEWLASETYDLTISSDEVDSETGVSLVLAATHASV